MRMSQEHHSLCRPTHVCAAHTCLCCQCATWKYSEADAVYLESDNDDKLDWCSYQRSDHRWARLIITNELWYFGNRGFRSCPDNEAHFCIWENNIGERWMRLEEVTLFKLLHCWAPRLYHCSVLFFRSFCVLNYFCKSGLCSYFHFCNVWWFFFKRGEKLLFKASKDLEQEENLKPLLELLRCSLNIISLMFSNSLSLMKNFVWWHHLL